jgi:RNA polymerase primary sigma factor
MAALEEWEETHESVLKEAHERDALEVVRRAGLDELRRDDLHQEQKRPHGLLNREQEFALGKKVEDGNAAFKELSEYGWKCDAERSELADRITAGQSAKRTLALMNLRLVASIARKVQRSFPTFDRTSLTFDDLLQEGDLGLLAAIERYDPSKGHRFSTYATWWIRQSMRKAVLNTGNFIRIPIMRAEQIRLLRNASSLFMTDHGRSPTSAELAEILNMKENTVKRVMMISDTGNTVQSLDKVLLDRKETLLSQIASDEETGIEELERAEATARLTDALTASIQKQLTRQEVLAIGMRYELNGGGRATYRAIGDALGIPSDHTVRKLISTGLAKIKRDLSAKKSAATGIDYISDASIADSALIAGRLDQLVAESQLELTSTS